jgi:hypothetical protein
MVYDHLELRYEFCWNCTLSLRIKVS